MRIGFDYQINHRIALDTTCHGEPGNLEDCGHDVDNFYRRRHPLSREDYPGPVHQQRYPSQFAIKTLTVKGAAMFEKLLAVVACNNNQGFVG